MPRNSLYLGNSPTPAFTLDTVLEPNAIRLLGPTGALLWSLNTAGGVSGGPGMFNTAGPPYNVVPDGPAGTNYQPNIQAAVNDCIANGGGTVLLPASSAGIRLSSGITVAGPVRKVKIMGTSPHTRIYADGFAGGVFNFTGVDSGTNANAYNVAEGLDVWANSIRFAGQSAFTFTNSLVSEARWCQAFNFATGFNLTTSYGFNAYQCMCFGNNIGLLNQSNGIFNWFGGSFDTCQLACRIIGVQNDVNFWGGQWDSDSIGTWFGTSTGSVHIVSDGSGVPNMISFNGIRFGSEQTPTQGNHAAVYLNGAATVNRIIGVTFNNCLFVNNAVISGSTGVAAAAIEGDFYDALLLNNCRSIGASASTLILGSNAGKARSLLLTTTTASPETAATGAGAAQYVAVT